MRKFIRIFAFITVVVMGAMSCSKDMADNNMSLTADGATLYATTPSENVTTKVGFEDKGEEGIAMSWEDGDSFKLYKSDGSEVDTFTTTGDGKFISSNLETRLIEGEEYTAKYNEGVDLAKQNGDDINNLNAACQMEATFTYGNGKPIKFAHTMAIMTFTFKYESPEWNTLDKTPDYLIFENGEESYKVDFSESIKPNDSGIYTSHIMINPCEATSRTLKFTIQHSYSIEYDIYFVESNIAYEAGKRYTAPINTIKKWDELAASEFAVYNEISTAAELALLAKNVNAGTTYSGMTFTLTKDIDLSGYEWVAIGNSTNNFEGKFDGDGHKITGLSINDDYGHQGLFSTISYATIKNLSVYGYVAGGPDVYTRVGGITGYAKESTISNCHNYATITGGRYNGGIAGEVNFDCSIINCKNSGSVTGSPNTEYCGGIVGNVLSSTVINCHNSASITNQVYVGKKALVGGIAGSAPTYYSNLSNCYNTGLVTGKANSNARIGGIVGYSGAYITNCYNVGNVIGDEAFHETTGSIAGYSDPESYGTITNCYYQKQSDLQSIANISDTESNCEIMTAAEMKDGSFVTLLNNNGYNYNYELFDDEESMCAWVTVANDYPTFNLNVKPEISELKFSGGAGKADVPYKITCRADFDELSKDVNSGTNYKGNYFIMKEDVDLGGSSKQFTAIGGGSNSFNGTFDGAGYTIYGLYINKSGDNCQALFGYTVGAIIKNLSVLGEVTGKTNTGGIVGSSSESKVINCHSGVEVSGHNYVGGVVGQIKRESTVANCYSSCDVNGSKSVGGVVGENLYSSTVVNCYSSGKVSGNENVGGIAGKVVSSSVIACVYNITVNSDASIPGVGSGDGETYGWTNLQMQDDYFNNALNTIATNYNSTNPAIEACGWVRKSGFPMLDFEYVEE